jgi:pyruvate,water dikinase
LVFRNQIDDASDVFYLHIRELRYNSDLRGLVRKRKAKEVFYQNMHTSNRLVFAEKVVDKNNSVVSGRVLTSENELCGIASSTGCITGEVLVVDVPSDKIDTTNKILVTKTTDPGWVFLIQNAVGIIAEKGSLLSHTAIISRELHKPAVVNVKDCTKILKTGDLVELNANEGTVRILRGDT